MIRTLKLGQHIKNENQLEKLYLLIQIFGESLWCWNLKTSHNWRNLQQQSFLLRKSSHLIFGWWRDPPEKGRFRNLWKVTDWWRFLDPRLYIICWVVKGWFWFYVQEGRKCQKSLNWQRGEITKLKNLNRTKYKTF